MLERLICVCIGYVFGLFQTSYFYGKKKGIDIREHGSGNAGSTNALRTMGVKAGGIAFLGDSFKCVFAMLTAYLLFRESYPDTVKLFTLYAAAGTILGHNFPFYMKFKGGKGIACTAGLLFAFDLRLMFAALVVFLVVYFATHYVSLGSICVYITFVAGLILLGEWGKIHVNAACLPEMYILVTALAALAIWKHRKNIVRLIHGKESKVYVKKKQG